jgi:MYXO-CTERM domain-containing protein
MLMKITNWCKKLSAALVAGGVLAPAAAHAADLGTNLVTNGDFESINLAVTGQYNAPLVLGWTGPNLFAYSHDKSSSSTGVVPDYADGADPPNAGHWYFTSNNTNVEAFTDVRASGVYFQDINVAAGATGSAISAGLARYNLGAFMSSYLNDNDKANVHVDFMNAGGTSLGTAAISDLDPGANNVWSLNSLNGIVPVGTASVRMSLFGTPVNGGADGYIDNVVFSISRVPEPTAAALAGMGLAAVGLGCGRRRRSE